MTHISQPGSAKIYQFPVGGRAALGRKREEIKSDHLSQLPTVTIGDGWYHDEAIRESNRTNEH
jgi:hypothetical protein